MGKPSLELYYDIVSPFGYIAYYMLRHSPVFKDVNVAFTPILLGGVMKAVGNRPPLEITNKKDWINLERLRWARLFDIPIAQTTPDNFPMPTLAIQRALTAITVANPQDQSKLIKASDAAYHAFWVERNEQQIQKAENFGKLLAGVLGEDDAKPIMVQSTSPEVKQTLNKRSETAVNEGMFGVPYFKATNANGDTQFFWGFDHLGQVCYHLGIDKPRANPRDGWQAML